MISESLESDAISAWNRRADDQAIAARDARIAELEEKISILDDVLESARIMIVVIDNDSVGDVSNISAYHRLKESVLNATN